MGYEPLHHKYRPQTFTDLVGQEAIATALSNAIVQQRIAPAYLFTGPRGTGKTSSARILAKSLNCIAGAKPTPRPCGQCAICQAITKGSALDVIEIDAASNTGVDNIREIIERAQFAPVQCRYKVYVIDEVHMLSLAAFNALLKTLEEPPERVVFVLATTDPQRVLPTIISRCQRFDYRRIPLSAMVNHLSQIAQVEAIAIKPAALTLVAQLANGGLRDAESLLDQLSLLPGPVLPEQVWDLVGTVPEQDLLTLLEAIAADNPEALLDIGRQILNRGREPLVVLQNLASFYLTLLIARTAPQRMDLVAVTASTWEQLLQLAQIWPSSRILQGQQYLREAEVQLRNTTQPQLWLEVTLLGLLPSALASAPTMAAATAVPPLPTPSSPPSPPEKAPLVLLAQSSPAEAVPASTTPSLEAPDSAQVWRDCLQYLSPAAQSLLKVHGSLLHLDLTLAQIGMPSDPLLRMAQKHQADVEVALRRICQRPLQVRFMLQTAMGPVANPPRPLPRTEAPQPVPDPPASAPASSEPLTPPPPKSPLASGPASSTDHSPQPLQPSPDAEAISHPQDLRKAMEKLAKTFDGEIIPLEETTSPTPPAEHKPLITGRPLPPPTTTDDDDLPF